MKESLPLFPLNTLLVPEATLPLQIFEQRYLRLIKQCLRAQSGFGVVPIRDGKEVGEPAMIYQVGCSCPHQRLEPRVAMVYCTLKSWAVVNFA